MLGLIWPIVADWVATIVGSWVAVCAFMFALRVDNHALIVGDGHSYALFALHAERLAVSVGFGLELANFELIGRFGG